LKGNVVAYVKETKQTIADLMSEVALLKKQSEQMPLLI